MLFDVQSKQAFRCPIHAVAFINAFYNNAIHTDRTASVLLAVWFFFLFSAECAILFLNYALSCRK